jgi:outer membrane protein W
VSHRIAGIVFVLLFALTLPLYAQNEIGLSLNSSELSESTIVDGGEEIRFDFDETVGASLSYNHYWTPSFSTEFAAIGFGGDMSLSVNGQNVFDVGELHASALTAMGQFHFNRAGRFSPYAGGGIAAVGGEIDAAPDFEDGEDSFELETETTWVAGLGADVKITQRWVINLDLRYMPWNARAEGDDIEDAVEIDPMIVSAGIRFRF